MKHVRNRTDSKGGEEFRGVGFFSSLGRSSDLAGRDMGWRPDGPSGARFRPLGHSPWPSDW